MSQSSPTTALLVIDLQIAMFHSPDFPPIHNAPALISTVRAVITKARDQGWPIAFIRHDGAAGDPLEPNSAGWPVLPALGQADDEPTFGKQVGDAFSDEALCDWIAHHGIDHVILVGAQSEHCITASHNGALSRGIDVTVVKDAHSTWDSDAGSADEIIDRQNQQFAQQGSRVIASDLLDLHPALRATR